MLLLNSDTVVTAGWLDRLLRPALADPRVGLVGPVTNNVTGVQKLARGGLRPAHAWQGLDAFAARHAAEHAGTSAPALWIVGFCLLIRREVVERLGGLDEIFGQGNYEDTDYCLRAFLAGFRAVGRAGLLHPPRGQRQLRRRRRGLRAADGRQLRDLPPQVEPRRRRAAHGPVQPGRHHLQRHGGAAAVPARCRPRRTTT